MIKFNKAKERELIAFNNRVFFSSYKPVHDQFFGLVGSFLKRGAKILDFGSGSVSSFDEFGNKQVQVFSMDSNFLRINENLNPRKVVGDGEAVPFKDSSLDIIMFKYVFEHIKNPQLVIKECCRCLKNGGYIIFLCPNKYSYISFLSRYTPFSVHKLLRSKIIDSIHLDTSPVYYRLNSSSKITELMQANRFSLVDIKSYVGYPTYWDFSYILHTIFCILHKLLEKLPFREFDISLIGAFQKKGD